MHRNKVTPPKPSESGTTTSTLHMQRQWGDYREGYPRLAAYMAHDPDGTTTIFRKFERLGMMNLLILESELASIERQLDTLDAEDSKEGSDSGALRASARDWDVLSALAKDVESSEVAQKRAQTRIDLLTELRKTLNEYC